MRRGILLYPVFARRMQVPSADDFRSETAYWVGPPWWAPVSGAGFDLHVSGWEGEPDPGSLTFAERVLPRVYRLRAEAARHIGQAVEVRGIPRLDPEIAQIVSVFCDGGSGTVVLELNWEVDLYNLWYVRFLDHPGMGLHPVEFGCRTWSGDLPRWRPPFRPVDG
ncbi:MAG TPA: hypothetical protein VFR37_09295 [Longimicrobium sp.]|nr:hypothetical protein [Longimicrobium sp.]